MGDILVMDINRLRQLSGMANNPKPAIFESFDENTKIAIERNKGRIGQPVLGPKENELPNTMVLSNDGNIIAVSASGGATIVIYDTLIEEKEDIFLPDEAIRALVNM